MKSLIRKSHILLTLCVLAVSAPWPVPVSGQDTQTAPAVDDAPGSVMLAAGKTFDRPQPVEKPGLDNCYQLSEDFYRGAQPAAKGFRQLKALGVKTVINLRHYHSDEKLVKGTGLDLVEVHMDAHDIDMDDLVEVFKVLCDSERHPVFVHCAHGSDRTGLVTALYRIAYYDWPRDKAYEEMTDGPFGFHSIWKNIEHTLKTIDVDKLKARADKARMKEKKEAEAGKSPPETAGIDH